MSIKFKIQSDVCYIAMKMDENVEFYFCQKSSSKDKPYVL